MELLLEIKVVYEVYVYERAAAHMCELMLKMPFSQTSLESL